MLQTDTTNELSDERLNQLDGYADSYRSGGLGERELAKRLKILTAEIRRLRKKEKTT